jgi:sugar-specific transcriptional regulator TrmB
MKERQLTDKELIAKIKANFNLNEYESKVWISLLMKGIATIGEIAEISGVPRSRVYDVLESLEKQGFVVMKLGKPIRYMALKPDEVIERIKTNLLNAAKEKASILDNIRNTEEFREIERLYNKGIDLINIDDTANLIRERFNINQAIRAALREAKQSVVIVTTTEKLNDKARILKPFMQKFQKDGVKVLIAASGEEKEGRKASRELGIKIRKIDIDARFIVIDGKEVFVMLNNGGNAKSDAAIHVKSPFFASALLGLLNTYMQK